MTRHQRLAAVSGVQLACGLAGLVLAVRGRHAFDIPGWAGSPEHVRRDAASMGTALSAPAPMLVAQAVGTAALIRGEHAAARRTLGALGAAMTCGYAIERLVRRRLTPSGWHAVESPVALAGITLAAAMAAAAIAAEREDAEGWL